MSFMGRFLAIAMLSLAFTESAGAQAPQVEKNVSMKMALMIIEGALEQCTKDGYKVSVVVVDKAGNVAASVRGDGAWFAATTHSRLWHVASFRADAALRSLSEQNGHWATLKALGLPKGEKEELK